MNQTGNAPQLVLFTTNLAALNSKQSQSKHLPGKSAGSCGKQAVTSSASISNAGGPCLSKPYHEIENFPTGIIVKRKPISHQKLAVWRCTLSTKGCIMLPCWKSSDKTTAGTLICPLRSSDSVIHMSSLPPQQHSSINKVCNSTSHELQVA